MFVLKTSLKLKGTMETHKNNNSILSLLRIVLLAVCCTSTSTGVHGSDYVALQNYVLCADKLFDITKENACPQLSSIKTCMEDLITDSGLRPDQSKPFCDDEEPYPYCSMLSNSRGAPMVGASHPTICNIYMKIKSCFDENCGPSGKNFKDPYDRYSDSSSHQEESCPKRATMDCISLVRTITKVTKDTCIAVGKAKNCFIDKLSDCSGKNEEQRAVDIILVGLVGHVYQCKENGYGFTKDGDSCAPNPLDVYLPSGIKDNLNLNPFVDEKEKEKALKAFMKANCPLVEKVGTDLENYLTGCSVTSHNLYQVSEVIDKLNGPRLQCMKAGYNLPQRECDCPGGSGSKDQSQANSLGGSGSKDQSQANSLGGSGSKDQSQANSLGGSGSKGQGQASWSVIVLVNIIIVNLINYNKL